MHAGKSSRQAAGVEGTGDGWSVDETETQTRERPHDVYRYCNLSDSSTGLGRIEDICTSVSHHMQRGSSQAGAQRAEPEFTQMLQAAAELRLRSQDTKTAAPSREHCGSQGKGMRAMGNAALPMLRRVDVDAPGASPSAWSSRKCPSLPALHPVRSVSWDWLISYPSGRIIANYLGSHAFLHASGVYRWFTTTPSLDANIIG